MSYKITSYIDYQLMCNRIFGNEYFYVFYNFYKSKLKNRRTLLAMFKIKINIRITQLEQGTRKSTIN